ncbi:BrnA antitoxin family protein [Methylomonas koyamae]|uniref:BrnA antitoxin family protein n=1 Tax=Methylomonas koyamae TaxID=702114 RepID=UPI002873747B|nr:BrnA antitoxin family protein [Methylomonas koyamae]WNB74359.1 BrnA antitoxin family protein [Methylomonas koyamae]
MTTVKKSLNDLAVSKKRLEELKAAEAQEIDYSEIPALDEAFWQEAVVKLPEPKTAVYIRLDAEMLEWFKQQGKGYQTRINAILKSYYEAHRHDLR